MRIGIIGAGAIGGTIAALLDRAGHDVEVVARGANLAVIRQDGILLSGAWGEHRAQVDAAETLGSTPELALVCAKAQDAGTAIRAGASRLTGIPVVIVQNGLDGLSAARELLPDSECVGAIAVFVADRPAPGHVTVATAGSLILGDGAGDPSPAAVGAARILDSALPSKAVADFAGHQWTKLVVNQFNSMPAITGLTAQATIADRGLRRITAASMREAAQIGLALGVRFGTIDVLSHGVIRVMARAPLSVVGLLLLQLNRRIGRTPVTGSTLQSIRQGHTTEIDYLNGAVVVRAESVRRTAPVNAALTTLVHEVEQTRRFLTRDEVVERVGPVR